MNLSASTREAILKLQKEYPHKRSALIPALHIAQSEKGFLCQKIQREVAELFDLDPNEVNAIVAFYDMFFDKATGKHPLRVCKNASCMLNGADEILETLCDHLQIEPGQTTADGLFTVIPSECLAACDKAPVMIADDKVIGPLKKEDLITLLETIKQRAGTPSPITAHEVHDG